MCGNKSVKSHVRERAQCLDVCSATFIQPRDSAGRKKAPQSPLLKKGLTEIPHRTQGGCTLRSRYRVGWPYSQITRHRAAQRRSKHRERCRDARAKPHQCVDAFRAKTKAFRDDAYALRIVFPKGVVGRSERLRDVRRLTVGVYPLARIIFLKRLSHVPRVNTNPKGTTKCLASKRSLPFLF